MNDDEIRLMSRLAEDDEDALAELVQRWQKPVLAFVCRYLACDSDEARDIAQEAFLRVWRSRHSWQPRARLSSWLFTIVTNLCSNHTRHLARRPTLVAVPGTDAVTAPSPAGDDPHARAEATELAARIRVALAELPENQRSALLLRRFEGMSYNDIAEVLSLSPSAVDALLTRARRALEKKILRPAQETPGSGVQHDDADDSM